MCMEEEMWMWIKKCSPGQCLEWRLTYPPTTGGVSTQQIILKVVEILSRNLDLLPHRFIL